MQAVRKQSQDLSQDTFNGDNPANGQFDSSIASEMDGLSGFHREICGMDLATHRHLLAGPCSGGGRNQKTHMKTFKLLLAACLLTTVVNAGELSDADQKWKNAVDQMFAQGATTISTPSESRVEIAKELAAKHGRECRVEKTAAGYKITLHTAKVAKN